jgi:hypothetical protein
MIEVSAPSASSLRVIRQRAQPTRALALALCKGQRTRILKRTARGQDFEGKPFVEYSKNGPIYYYPAGRATGRATRSQRDAASRLFKSITGKASRGHMGRKKALSGPHGEAWVTPGGGLGFSSYDALKKWAGRTNVDLRGLKAPHMLQAMQVKATAQENQAEGVIGIYGPKAKIAQDHNKGNVDRKLPKRKFLAASKADEREMKKEVEIWLRGRIRVR